MRLVVGLGNPGPRYHRTRHNLGFWVLDELIRRHGGSFRRREGLTDLARIAEISFAGHRLVLAKPTTLMNRSGRAAQALCEKLDLAVSDLLVVQDDADLELGRLRIRAGGSAGGHNGIRSIIAALASAEFTRVKLGVRGAGRGEQDLADYVLEEFDPEERPAAQALAAAGADAVEAILESGLAAAMSRYNGRGVDPPGG